MQQAINEIASTGLILIIFVKAGSSDVTGVQQATQTVKYVRHLIYLRCRLLITDPCILRLIHSLASV